jgi:iron complex transport system permease protein
MKNMRMGVILAGIAITALLNAAISFLNLLNSDVLVTYNAFSVGGVSGVLMEDLLVPGVTVAICLVLVCVFWKKIRILCLGDLTAASLGVNVRFLRVFCMVCASASAGAVVSFAGLLGFVGLVVPHIARRLVGGDAKKIILISVPVSATLVLLGDLLGRILLSPTEIPVGIVMALVGAPFFLYVIVRRSRSA